MTIFPWDFVFPLRVKVGAEVKKDGETLTWKVVEIDDLIVVLVGPGGRKGRMVLERDEFNKHWGKV